MKKRNYVALFLISTLNLLTPLSSSAQYSIETLIDKAISQIRIEKGRMDMIDRIDTVMKDDHALFFFGRYDGFRLLNVDFLLDVDFTPNLWVELKFRDKIVKYGIGKDLQNHNKLDNSFLIAMANPEEVYRIFSEINKITSSKWEEASKPSDATLSETLSFLEKYEALPEKNRDSEYDFNGTEVIWYEFKRARTSSERAAVAITNKNQGKNYVQKTRHSVDFKYLTSVDFDYYTDLVSLEPLELSKDIDIELKFSKDAYKRETVEFIRWAENGVGVQRAWYEKGEGYNQDDDLSITIYDDFDLFLRVLRAYNHLLKLNESTDKF